MPVISSFALQYSQVNFSAIFNSTYDLFITEGAPLAPGGGFPAISDAQVSQLLAQGRTVVGYVNVCVTDDARYYWNPSWTSNGQDTGMPVPGQAPSWLDQAVPLNFDGVPGQDALIVEYWDPAWRHIVIDQAVALVQRGYSGVFLDDIGRYYDAGFGSGLVPLMADRMVDLVHAVTVAIKAVNPNAIVVANTNPYIATDNTGGTSGTRSATYRADVDIHLIENQNLTTHGHFATHFAGEPLLVLQSGASPPLTYEQAWALGILYSAPQGYGAPGTFAYPATQGADTLNGGDAPNQISGLGGNDMLNGGAAADTLTGGLGNDTYIVDTAGDVVIEAAGEGDDSVRASASYQLAAAASVETLSTTTDGGTAAINLTGNDVAQSIFGNNGNNMLLGLGGNDQLVGYGGNDVLVGGTGTDVLRGGLGNDVYGIDDQDIVFEANGEGDDSIAANVSSYFLNAGASIETLSTANQASTSAQNLTGNELGQSVFGSQGVNALNGGGGIDSLTGYGGADFFVFNSALGTANADVVTDFVSGSDRIVIDNAVFLGLAEGNIAAGQFRLGTAAQDADDRILYDAATGRLFFDADGNGAGAALLFATLGGAPGIAASDFMVV